MRKLIYIAIVGCLVVSCASRKEVSTSTRLLSTNTSDSITTVKRVIPVDTLVVVPKDSISLSVPLNELSETPIERTNGRTTARVSYRNNNIDVECLTEEYEQIITLQKEVIETLQKIIKEQKETIDTKTVITKTPWYLQPITWIIGFVIILVLKNFKLI